MTTVADGLFQYGGVPVGPGSIISLFTGNWYFVDPANGQDGNKGTSPSQAFATLYQAYAHMTAGQNDVCVLIGDGSTTGTARLSLALAQSITPAATTGTLTWAKNACHLIGVTAPTAWGARARIAPPSGTYTQSTFGSGNLFVVTATGCYFGNFSLFHGFSTGGTNQICWTDSGGRNSYESIQFGGMGDAASAADTGSHSLVISGTTGENKFTNCTIGLDTVARSSGVSEMAFSGGSPRNVFERCTIDTNAGAAGCFWVAIPSGGIDRYAVFKECMFLNPTLGGPAATAMTVGMSINASAGGVVVTDRCLSYGATKLTTGGLAVTNLPASAAGGGLVTAIT